MIRLDRIELLHWDIQPHQVLALSSGITVLTGENGSGKTAILDAIKVGLGAQLEGERTTKSYLLKQAAPVAMIRILVDNRTEPGSRRRPFDVLGGPAQETVTLAVVFRAGDEGDYVTEYWILDGDVVPLDERSAGRRKDGLRPLPSREAYRERLRKVGIGRQYLKLLCLPQGQIASFCRKAGPALFEDLFDVIGGRQALDTWNERVRDLNAQRRTFEATQTDLREASRNLELLKVRVRRHHEFRAKKARAEALERAEPYARRAEAEAEYRRLETERDERTRRIASLDAIAAEADAAREAAAAEIEGIARTQAGLQGAYDIADSAWKEAIGEQADCRAKLKVLEDIRRLGEPVAPADVDTLRSSAEALRADLARGQAVAAERQAVAETARRDLDQVRKGLLPLPPEVEAFQARLRQAGIPHHLLAEVVEVRDPSWRPALEGWLGRLRLAVVVQDLDAWSRAAALVRETGYPHGVLAPDVRGSSPADQEGLVAGIDVKEPRYRALVARLLRAVQPGEHETPLQPMRRGERLSSDGFVVTRLEARSSKVGDAYLGRAALEQRRADLEERLGTLDRADRTWKEEELRLRGRVGIVEEEIAAQRHRAAWEAARSEWVGVKTALARLDGEVQGRAAERSRIQAEIRDLGARIGSIRESRGTAEGRAQEARTERDRVRGEDQEAATRRREVEETLGALRVEVPDEPDEEVEGILADEMTPRMLQASRGALGRELATFTAEEQDDLLPVNAARQEQEVAAVANRLETLRASLDLTQKAAEEAREQYQDTTRRVFRAYFARLREAAEALDFHVEGRLDPREDGRFSCDVRVRVGEKPPVHHDSEDLSGGQKAALSILMGMTAISLESEGAGFFLIDEPFAASDVHKINELGEFLARTRAQYLLSMPTTADLERCGTWLESVWTCTRSRGGFTDDGHPVLAPRVRLGFVHGGRDVG